jgi:hypothetical protein
VRGDERLSARQRIAIYADAYFYRLLDCMKEDFPATLAVAGESAFHDLVVSYLVQHSPTEPSIFHLGQHLSSFLFRHPLQERWPFVAELASLERALIDVFHGPDAKPLTPADLRVVAPTDWPTFMLRTHPALQVLDCRWRVTDVLRALDSGADWSEPHREAVAVLVWRQVTQVYYRELEPSERDALAVTAKGASFSAICEAFATRLERDGAAGAINRMLTRWLTDGILIRGETKLAS